MALHDTFRPLPAGAGMCEQIEHLTAEAERQVSHGLWVLTDDEAALARKTACGLADAVRDASEHEDLPVIDRLERLREALAVLAISIARTHGQLAWFLAQASTALVPVLHWRALRADERSSFGTVAPAPGDLTDAERAVRRLRDALARAITGTATARAEGRGPRPAA
ncbi:hypothetical protein ACFVHB_17055 [Kitasatospora sp. NPDC127111]|uniref:hypothetical protein n=1 Tax=Kitasatospora sp. NPDC127111 TaxID=3345363 RepID=UPI003638CAB2